MARVPEGLGTALITGGARRIGRAIAEHLAQHGYDIAIHYGQSQNEAEALATDIRSRNAKAVALQADLSDADAVSKLGSQAHDAMGPVTLLVNNASLFEPDGIEALELPLWEQHFAVNLRAPCLLASQMAAHLPPERQGCIVNIIDQRVLRLNPQFFSYTLTKSALWTATQTMAQALAPRIRVNAVAPGPTLANIRQGPEDFAKQSAAVLLQRGGTPIEVAKAVLFLAQNLSITGQMIAVDGGQHLAWQTPDVAGVRE